MPPTLQLRQRAPVLVFLVAALYLLAATLLATSDDYAQSSLQQHEDFAAQLHVQTAAPTAEDSRLGSSPDSDSHDRDQDRRLRVGLAGAGSGKGKQVVGLAHQDDLSFTVQRGELASPTPLPADADSTRAHSQAWPYVRYKLDQAATSLGDLILGIFGFDEEDWFGLGDIEGDASETGLEGGSLATWSESSVYVERTNSLHPSRPSSFGPHLLTEPLRGLLFPVEAVVSTDAYGCKAQPSASSPLQPHPGTPWIALVQRGHCPFSQKVRFAQEHGAEAVVFGDESEEEGGISGGHGLLTPWSPDDTADITIPSTFVSHASYLSLLRTWNDEQGIMRDGSTQIDSVNHEGEELVGLEVVLSKDEIFAWPLLDLLFMLLFLPSLLTLVTVFVQRVRVARALKAERAPKDAVARLPVFRWGEAEKPSGGTPARNLDQDEEREVGIAHIPVTTATEPTEETALLHREAAHAPSLVERLSSRIPPSVARCMPKRFRPSTPPAPHRAAPRPTRRYPSLTECPFCLSDFEAGDLVMELPCSHVFHAEEIETWLQQQKGICPICRMSVLAAPQPDAAAVAAATHEGRDALPQLPEGTVVLINPLRSPPGLTATADPTAAASPVASSSSVPLDGVQAPRAD